MKVNSQAPFFLSPFHYSDITVVYHLDVYDDKIILFVIHACLLKYWLGNRVQM